MVMFVRTHITLVLFAFLQASCWQLNGRWGYNTCSPFSELSVVFIAHYNED